MPELAVKIKMTPSSSSTMMSGMSHHFFSCLANFKNSLNSDHMVFGECRSSPRLWQMQNRNGAGLQGLEFSEIISRPGVARFETEGFLKLVLGIIEPALLGQQHAVIEMCPGIIRIQSRSRREFISGLVKLAG